MCMQGGGIFPEPSRLVAAEGNKTCFSREGGKRSLGFFWGGGKRRGDVRKSGYGGLGFGFLGKDDGGKGQGWARIRIVR